MRTTLRSIDPTLEASDDEEVLASGGDEAIRFRRATRVDE